MPDGKDQETIMEKIYDSSPLTTGFTAGVTSCIPSEGGKYSVTLDRTAFFPGGGGQECDTGYIGGARVASVTESGGVPAVRRTCRKRE